MASYVGIPPNDPSKYLGPTVSLESIVVRNRAPTGADIRQGSTGRYYPIGSLWIVSKDPTTGLEGDLWWLSKIVANVAYWLQIPDSLTTTLQIDTPNGDAIPVAGIINFLNGTGMDISASGNSVTFDLTGDVAMTFTCDSGSATPSANTLIITGSPTGLTTAGTGNTVSLTGTLVVAHGGTSATSFNINGAVISNTTTTGAMAAVTLGSQQFLVGNTSGAPTAKALSVVTQTFTGSGTYTPTAGMVYCIMEIVGGGGGSGGCVTTAAGQYAASGSGGGGGYSRKTVSAAGVGASQTVTIGAGGTAGAAGNNSGGTGGTTSIGAIISATGGAGGGSGGPTAAGSFWVGSASPGGGGSGGDINANGQPGLQQYIYVFDAVTAGVQGSSGGSSYFGGGAHGVGNVGAAVAGLAYGGGAAGGAIAASTTQIAGAAGGNGFAVITEYVIV